MRRFLRMVTPPIFIAFWFLINILPAGLAELTSDEGYYWFLANGLEWGYYDHPPMLALLVAIGTSIAPGELGVRLLNVVFSTLWLRYYRFGPLEWLWRSLTYWKRQPLQRVHETVG